MVVFLTVGNVEFGVKLVQCLGHNLILVVYVSSLGVVSEENILEDDGGCDHNGGNDVLHGGVLRGDEDYEHENHEHVGVEPQEIKLQLVVDHLHAVVGVKVPLVDHNVEDQPDEDEEEHDRCVEAEEGHHRPKFE